jgi:hypothetical protein
MQHALLVGRRHAALDLVGQPAVILKPARQVSHLAEHLDLELAVVTHFQFGQPFRIRGDQFADLVEEHASVARMHGGPGPAGKRAVGCLRGPFDILGVSPGNNGPGSSGEGILGLKPPPRDRLAPFAVDEHPEGLEPVRDCAISLVPR